MQKKSNVRTDRLKLFPQIALFVCGLLEQQWCQTWCFDGMKIEESTHDN